MSEDEFKVGDLITLKHHRGNPDAPPPLAIVVALEAIVENRILIQHRGTSGPEMAAPEHWEVVSRCESR
tara:strand:- start:928 stop:1134 length:207 start_codon:yes stop_codon:yes gene_type:complete